MAQPQNAGAAVKAAALARGVAVVASQAAEMPRFEHAPRRGPFGQVACEACGGCARPLRRIPETVPARYYDGCLEGKPRKKKGTKRR